MRAAWFVIVALASGCRWIDDLDLHRVFTRTAPPGSPAPPGSREFLFFCTEMVDGEYEHPAILVVADWFGEGSYTVDGNTVHVTYNRSGAMPAFGERLEFDLVGRQSPQLPGDVWTDVPQGESCGTIE